ncbi:glutathione peroxidase [Bdellovibrio bacteriovorus]|uniref:Glutathione peroxidase n=1 Tax=Bdellovibrio bacteriovorus TaxID=959 RepID=A0A150WVT5_BDEBC|nr:redoxin domain-containing protein [Bdellovibrio bacteriovorus]KYG70630.1 glutathione peroxidase [Bdellovibrio bacteriovorus]
MSTGFYAFTMKNIRGESTPLENFKGKVALVVNVASECGLTPQYEGLEKIYEKYQEKGFTILGFPANEFGAQEPGSNAEIQSFCQSKFGIKFPMFEKIVVKGEDQHPLYRFLIEKKPTATLKDGVNFEQQLKEYGIVREKKEDILWNFEKFLINREGEVIARFSPDITPEDPIIIKALEAAL